METLARTNDGKFMAGIVYSPQTMFKPGHLSHNKGKKFPGSGNCQSFKKGNQPHNTLYDLATRTRTNNQGRTYVFIRISMGNWDFLQRYRWKNEVGPIPKNMVLRCKSGDTTNCDPSNWELMTKSENAQRNRFECSDKTNTCKSCNKEFQSKSRQTKFCSDDCRKAENLRYMQEWHAKNDKPRKEKKGPKFLTENVKQCQVCQSAFFPNSNRQITCSDGCKTIHHHLRMQKYKSEKKALVIRQQKHCSKCGSLFTPARNSSTICTLCREAKPRQVKCLYCGKDFISEGKGVKLLCSDECRRERRNLLHANYGLKERGAAPRIMISCQVCGTQFERRKGSKYCSDDCKKVIKKEENRTRRQMIREGKLPKPVRTKPAVKANCCVCGVEFDKYHKIRYCSDGCRTEMKRQKGSVYNKSLAKPKKEKPPKGLVNYRPVSRRKPKAEKDLALTMLELNRAAPKHDREIIDLKNIVSPDLSKIEFRYYDEKLRITRFFKSEERYNNFLIEKQNEKTKI